MNQKYFKRTFLLSVYFFISFILSLSPVKAYSFEREVEVTINVVADTDTRVIQKHTLSWDNPSRFFPANKNEIYVYISPAFKWQEENIDKRIYNLSVKNEYGKKIDYKKVIDGGAILLKIPYYENLEQYNNLEFIVEYNTSMYSSFEGGVLDIVYPGLPKDFSKIENNDDFQNVNNYSLKINVPNKYGQIRSYPTPSKSEEKNKSTDSVIFNTNKLIGNSIRLSVGDQRIIKFSLEGVAYSTNNNTPDFIKDIWVNYIEIALPTSEENTEFSNQQVYFTKIEPFPESIRRDANGNILARFPVSATEDQNILIEGYAVISDYELPESLSKVKIADIPISMSPYLAEESKYWQTTSSKIREIAIENKSDFEYTSLQSSMKKVSDILSYANISTDSQLVRQGAVEALNSGVGVCMEYSDLLLSILRAQGIPARAVYGDGLGSRVDKTLDGVGHQWVGVWFPEAGWVPVEPTWSDEGYLRIGHDLDHFTWYVASESVNEPLGFDCQTLDSYSPCKDALKINTESVESLPNYDELMTITDMQNQIDKQKVELTKAQKIMQDIVVFLGSSAFGRLVLSRQGLIISAALFLYILLLLIVSFFTKLVRKNKKVD